MRNRGDKTAYFQRLRHKVLNNAPMISGTAIIPPGKRSSVFNFHSLFEEITGRLCCRFGINRDVGAMLINREFVMT